ncbi:MAG: tetratricopeptide repeat protein [Gemmatimonadales bacterium]
MTSRVLAVLILGSTAAAGSLGAQNTRLAETQKGKYAPPLCPLKALNKNVERGADQLKKAYDAKTPAEKATLLAGARQSLTTAITAEAQDKNPAAWYYLGRMALLEGNARAVDSAWTKAQELQPACEIDINSYRQNTWAALANVGLEMQRNGQTDSALALFREASWLFRGLPHVFANMGVVFANADQPDSSVAYFTKALEIAEKDTSLVEDRNSSALNLAIMLQRVNRFPDAIATYRKYLGWNPGDTEARKALAGSFRAAGMEDSATAIELAMVAEFSKSNLDSLDLSDLMAVGVAAFNAGRYQEAENAFKKAVQRNPWSRDARYNLANSYFAMANAARAKGDSLRKAKLVDSATKVEAAAAPSNQMLVAEAQKLLEIEPLNEDGLRLLAQGQRALKEDDAVLKTAERLIALPFSIEVTGFQMGQSGAKFTGEATGRNPLDPKGNPLKTAPMVVVLEFMNTSGAVVDTKEFTIPVLKEGAKHPVQVEGKGEGIAGWRYRQKSAG